MEAFNRGPGGEDTPLGGRRRLRGLLAVLGVVGLVGLIAGLMIPRLVGNSGSPQTRSAGSGPDGVLVAEAGGSVRLVSPADGRVLYTIRLNTGVSQISWLSASPDRHAVYATLKPASMPACWTPAIDRIDLTTGNISMVGHGLVPAADSTGTKLAYIDPAAPGDCPGQRPEELVVRTLATGAEQRWDLPPLEPMGVPTALSWSPDGRRIALDIAAPDAERVAIADPTQPTGHDALGGPAEMPMIQIPDATATYLHDGQLILAFLASCPMNQRCVGNVHIAYVPPQVVDRMSQANPEANKTLAESHEAAGWTGPSPPVDLVVASLHQGNFAYLSGTDLYTRFPSTTGWQHLLAGVTAATWSPPQPETPAHSR